MSDISMVRSLIGDRKKKAVNEQLGEGDGTNKTFQLDAYPIVSSPTASISIFLTGVTAATNSYVVSGDVGVINFTAAPANGSQILVCYEYYTLSSGEISDVLSGLAGKPYLAASRAALMIAADSSRLFAYTMGDKSVDKRKVSRNLLDLSAQLETMHYNQTDKENFNATVATMLDSTGTPFYGYDTAVAYLNDNDY